MGFKALLLQIQTKWPKGILSNTSFITDCYHTLFITAILMVKVNKAKSPACPRTKNVKSSEFYQSVFGRTQLGLRAVTSNVVTGPSPNNEYMNILIVFC